MDKQRDALDLYVSSLSKGRRRSLVLVHDNAKAHKNEQSPSPPTSPSGLQRNVSPSLPPLHPSTPRRSMNATNDRCSTYSKQQPMQKMTLVGAMEERTRAYSSLRSSLWQEVVADALDVEDPSASSSENERPTIKKTGSGRRLPRQSSSSTLDDEEHIPLDAWKSRRRTKKPSPEAGSKGTKLPVSEKKDKKKKKKPRRTLERSSRSKKTSARRKKELLALLETVNSLDIQVRQDPSPRSSPRAGRPSYSRTKSVSSLSPSLLESPRKQRRPGGFRKQASESALMNSSATSFAELCRTTALSY